MMEGAPRRGTCPYCGVTYVYSESSRLSDGTVRCQNCEAAFMPMGEVVYSEPAREYERSTTQSTQSPDTWIIVVVIVLEILFVPILFLILVLPVTWWCWTNRNKNRQRSSPPTSSSRGW